MGISTDDSTVSIEHKKKRTNFILEKVSKCGELLSTPHTTFEAGYDAIVKFAVQSTVPDITLRKIPSQWLSSSKCTILNPLCVDERVYCVDWEEGKLVFPKITVENGGYYIINYNGSQDIFHLEVSEGE